MRGYGRDEVSARRKVQKPEQDPLNGGLHRAGLALVQMRQPEGCINRQK